MLWRRRRYTMVLVSFALWLCSRQRIRYFPMDEKKIGEVWWNIIMLFIRSFVRRLFHIHIHWLACVSAHNTMMHGYVYTAKPASYTIIHACERPFLRFASCSLSLSLCSCPWHGLLLTSYIGYTFVRVSTSSQRIRCDVVEKTTSTHQRKNVLARTRTNAEPKSYYNTYLYLPEIWWGCASVAAMSKDSFRCVPAVYTTRQRVPYVGACLCKGRTY